MRRAMLLGFAAAPCLLTSALLTGPATAGSTAAGSGTAGPGFTAPAAPDGPGATSYLDLGRKDCLGTARNTTSKVWYTVAGGVLSDVYYPTTDNTNVKTVQYIVTDGRTFTDLQSGDPAGASQQLAAMSSLATGVGMIPEQDWEDPGVPAAPYGTDPTTASIGFTDGQPAGSAGEITWAEAQYVRLAQDIATGTVGDQPSIVRDRYVAHGAPGQAPLTITAPSDGAQVTGGTVTVSGVTVPGATVVVAATLSPAGATAAGGTAHSAAVPANVTQVTAGADGTFSVTLPDPAGGWVVTAASTAPSGATGYAQVTITAS